MLLRWSRLQKREIDMNNNQIMGGMMGAVIGDALGVPYEFRQRDSFKAIGMTSGGYHNQPLGTWSDDSALLLALADGLGQDMNIQEIGNLFVKWRMSGAYTPDGVVFDIGATTNTAIYNIANGIYPTDAGLKGVHNNGNGALMRILPVAIKYIDDDFREENVEAVASMTHGHKLSIDCCKIYVEMAVDLLHGMNAIEAYRDVCLRFKCGCDRKLKRFLSGKLLTARRDQIDSSGYDLSTLEAAVWSLLHNDNYKDTVLAAVNLGDDTDTTACVAGGLAGILYGYDAIPELWLKQLRGRDQAEAIARKLCQ